MLKLDEKDLQTPLKSEVKSPKAKDSNTKGNTEKKKQKMIITGDDILIEYVARIIKLLQNILTLFMANNQGNLDRVDNFLPPSIFTTLDQFANHKIWSSKLTQEQTQQPLFKRL